MKQSTMRDSKLGKRLSLKESAMDRCIAISPSLFVFGACSPEITYSVINILQFNEMLTCWGLGTSGV